MNRCAFFPYIFLAASLLCGCTFFSGAGPEAALRGPVGPNTHEANIHTPAAPRILTIGTADSGGTMYPAGEAISKILSEGDAQLRINISASSGSIANIHRLEDGQFDLGLVSGDVAYNAYHGLEEFEGRPVSSLRAIAAVYTSLSNWISLDASDIRCLEDLKGMRVSVGPHVSSSELAAWIALDAAGLNTDDISSSNYGLGSGSKALEERSLDAVHGLAGIPVPSFLSLSRRTPVRVIPYTREELNRILTENPFYYPDIIPANTYAGQTEDIETFGVKCLLCADASLDEATVYEITQLICQSAPAVFSDYEMLPDIEDTAFLHENLPIPLHPGAEKYYLELPR